MNISDETNRNDWTLLRRCIFPWQKYWRALSVDRLTTVGEARSFYQRIYPWYKEKLCGLKGRSNGTKVYCLNQRDVFEQS